MLGLLCLGLQKQKHVTETVHLIVDRKQRKGLQKWTKARYSPQEHVPKDILPPSKWAPPTTFQHLPPCHHDANKEVTHWLGRSSQDLVTHENTPQRMPKVCFTNLLDISKPSPARQEINHNNLYHVSAKSPPPNPPSCRTYIWPFMSGNSNAVCLLRMSQDALLLWPKSLNTVMEGKPWPYIVPLS